MITSLHIECDEPRHVGADRIDPTRSDDDSGSGGTHYRNVHREANPVLINRARDGCVFSDSSLYLPNQIGHVPTIKSIAGEHTRFVAAGRVSWIERILFELPSADLCAFGIDESRVLE
jgi:hypothetical protein